MAVSAPETVEIEGHWYSLIKIPGDKSPVVLAEQKSLLGNVDLETLVTDLSRVGGFIRMAYNGVGAAGSKFTDEQIEIQQLGYDITNLCDKSALTVASFKKASRSIVIDLQATYGYLLDSFEEIAIDTLSGILTVSEDMKKVALGLTKDFETEVQKVLAILKQTEKVKGEHDQLKIAQEKKQEEWRADEKIEEQFMEEQQVKEVDAESRRKKLELEEDEAISRIGEISGKTRFLKEFVNGLTGTRVFKAEGETNADTKRKQRLKALEAEQAIREQRQAAIVKMSAFAVKIKQCNTEESVSLFAVEALHHAAGALTHLSIVMSKAALFWQQMQEHCSSLSKHNNVKSQVKIALDSKYTNERRLTLWTHNSFKMKAIMFYAQWVALHGVCDVYMERIKETQQELYMYLAENPTWEESRKNVKEMAAKFLTTLQQDQLAITEQKFEAQQEIDALKEKMD